MSIQHAFAKLLFLAAVLMAPTAALAQSFCGPEKLTRMVVRIVSPNLSAAAPAAQPKTIYRKGPMQGRIEETADFVRGVQALTVISEPDIWTVNTMGRTGAHRVDPGPDYLLSMPIVAGAGEPASFRDLQFGCEMDFISRRAALPIRTIQTGSGSIAFHAVEEGQNALAFIVDVRRQTPIMITYARGGKPVFAVRYDSYVTGLADQPTLFQKPAGIEFQEIKEVPKPSGPPAG